MESNPNMARFIAAEAARIVADNGTKCANFEPGETQAIHKDLWGPAIAAGLVPENPADLVEKPEDKKPERQTLSREERNAAGLLEAVKELIARGDPKDFTVVGLPRTASVKNLVDFDFTAREVQTAFELAIHEVNQNGNDSQERAEPSSDASQ